MFSTCDECEEPTALAVHLTRSPAVARRIMRALDGKLGLGLPYAIHTDQLGVEPRQIAVVTGNFSTRAAAEARAASTTKLARHAATVIDLGAGDREVRDEPRHVIVIDRGARVPAWRPADVDAVVDAMDTTGPDELKLSYVAKQKWILDALAKRTPACLVDPGMVYVAEDHEVAWQVVAPVRCGGKLAYVDWRSTLLGNAVIVPEGSGHVLTQIIGMECYSPVYERWRYDREGRHPLEAEPDDDQPVVVAARGCPDGPEGN